MSAPAPSSASSSPSPFPALSEKYDVERVLGRGGMGTVFEARHLRLGHRVAIKVLAEDLRVHPELVARFEREGRAASALSSPHAVRVFDIDTTEDGTPFMVMELLGGCDLARRIEEEGPQPIGIAVRWVIEACDAIGEAHRLGIVHRDIKPSNLLLCENGAIKVLDFGIAKHVAPGKTKEKEAAITLGVAPLGTPQYMSPEQVRCAKEVDGRTDIWSLGVTLYELVCGRPPYDHEVPQACVAAIVADPVPDPRTFRADLPEPIAAAILRALAKDPAERFQTVEELVETLTPFADAVSPVKESGGYRKTTVRLVAEDQTTLDGEGLLIELVAKKATPAASPKAAEPVAARGALGSMSTVPPAVTRASLAGRGRKIRSGLAFASAAVLGLAALVSTPRCVTSRIETTQASTPPPSLRPVAVANVASALTPAASAEATPEPPAPVTEAPRPSAEPARPTARRPRAVSPTASTPVRFVGDSRPVHGGLTSPGF